MINLPRIGDIRSYANVQEALKQIARFFVYNILLIKNIRNATVLARGKAYHHNVYLCFVISKAP